MARAKSNPFADSGSEGSQEVQDAMQGQGIQVVPDSPRTNPIEPIGMTPTVDKDQPNTLCFARAPKGSPEGSDATETEKMPDLSSFEDAVAYLKANPSVLWQMSKAEIIATLCGPDQAKAYLEAPASETTT